jgi:PAS domain S-box-containing protein
MTKPRKEGNSRQAHRQASHASQRGPGDQLAALRAKLAESRSMISRYKAKERALSKEQEALLSILENTPCGIGINRGIFGKILYQNHEFVRMFGYTADDIPTVRDWIPKAYPNKAYRQQVTRTWVETIEGIKGSNVLSVTCKDGSVKEIELITKVLPDRTAVNMFLDVTRREKAEEALRESETKFRLLFEYSGLPAKRRCFRGTL